MKIITFYNYLASANLGYFLSSGDCPLDMLLAASKIGFDKNDRY